MAGGLQAGADNAHPPLRPPQLCEPGRLMRLTPGLRGAALTCLAKLMVVDARYCDHGRRDAPSNLQRLFTLLQHK